MSANKTIYLGNDKKRIEDLLNTIGESLSRQGVASVMVKGKVSHSAVIVYLIDNASKQEEQSE